MNIESQLHVYSLISLLRLYRQPLRYNSLGQLPNAALSHLLPVEERQGLLPVNRQGCDIYYYYAQLAVVEGGRGTDIEHARKAKTSEGMDFTTHRSNKLSAK
jgi:hypothetical protein